MSNDQKMMKSLEIDSEAFSVLYDAQSISIQILYKGVPIQVITFGTSGPLISGKETEDAIRLGRMILRCLILGDKIPFHLRIKALIVERDELAADKEWWEGNLIPDLQRPFGLTLERILNEPKRNYSWYESQVH